jgi:hypothetical protein
MAKRPAPGKCVHCLKDPVERDWDHVFPEAFYPSSSPKNQYKWQIPSCVPCNSALGKIEDDFLRRVGLCLDPFSPASRDIALKAFRAHTPEAGKNERDRNARAALRKRVFDQALEAENYPQEAIYPGMGVRSGIPKEDHLPVLIPVETFDRLTEKIVRGIFYVADRKFIEPPFTVESFALDPSVSGPIQELIEKFATTYAREPGIIVRRAVTDDGISSLFEIEFWGQLKRYATVRPGT